MSEPARRPVETGKFVLVVTGPRAEPIDEIEVRAPTRCMRNEPRLADETGRVMLRRQPDPHPRAIRHDRRLTHERADEARLAMTDAGGEHPDLAVEKRKDGLCIVEAASMASFVSG